jgi:integrase
MGRKSERSGVSALGRDRVQFDFEFEGRRYRPSIKRIPTQGNLDRALGQLRGIRKRIARGTFSFVEAFPDYRFMKEVPGASVPRTCDVVFDAFIKHCESRVAKKDMAFVTLYGYKNILDGVWRPAIGKILFESVRYSDLLRTVDHQPWSKETYNKAISVVRCAFEFGYRDVPERPNPAAWLKSLRITRKDRAPIAPFTATEAEILILALHRDWGEAQGNYDEFRFFTGLRPSEQIALLVSDCDLVAGKINVTKARVMGRDKDRTKTSVDRTVELCPRALQVLKRQLALRDRLEAAGLLDHELLFCKEDGAAITNLQFSYERWKKTLNQTVKGRYREPYNTRHTSVTWNLMAGKNLLWVSKQHGHSAQVMLGMYAAWIERGGDEAEIAAIKAAMETTPPALRAQLAEGRPAAMMARRSRGTRRLAMSWQQRKSDLPQPLEPAEKVNQGCNPF